MARKIPITPNPPKTPTTPKKVRKSITIGNPEMTSTIKSKMSEVKANLANQKNIMESKMADAKTKITTAQTNLANKSASMQSGVKEMAKKIRSKNKGVK